MKGYKVNKLLPLFFDLKGKSILLVGAGRVAKEKLEKLIRTDASITVVAPDISEEILDFAYLHPEKITIVRREYRSKDALPHHLVIIATNHHDINTEIVTDCHRLGKLVNAVDDRTNCDFLFSAQIHYGPTQIAVSSEGRLPGLAKAIREILEEILPQDHHTEVSKLIDLRQRLKKLYPDITERTHIFRHMLKQWDEQYLKPHYTQKKLENYERNSSL